MALPPTLHAKRAITVKPTAPLPGCSPSPTRDRWAPESGWRDPSALLPEAQPCARDSRGHRWAQAAAHRFRASRPRRAGRGARRRGRGPAQGRAARSARWDQRHRHRGARCPAPPPPPSGVWIKGSRRQECPLSPFTSLLLVFVPPFFCLIPSSTYI